MAQPLPSPRVIEPVVFNTAIEGLLLRALGDRLPAKTRAEIRQTGIDLDKPLAPAYTPEQWVKAVAIAVAEVFPGLTEDEAYFRLGQEFIHGLQRTLVGKALFAFGVVVGPRRMLARMTTGFRSANNYMETETRENGEATYIDARVVPALLEKMSGRPAVSPHYVRGILFQCLTSGGAKDVSVELVSHDDAQRASRYEVRYAA